MPADVSKLLNKLRGEYPELNKEPLLDEIESAAYGEDEEMDEMEDEFEMEPLEDEEFDFEDDEDFEEEEEEDEDDEFVPAGRSAQITGKN